MFERKINDKISLQLLVPQHAQELAGLVEKNVSLLESFPLWKIITGPEQAKLVIDSEIEKFAKQQSLSCGIYYKQKLIGIAGYNLIDEYNGVADFMIWIDRDFHGKWVAIPCAKHLIELAFKNYSINKIQATCIPENKTTAALAKRLDFMQEGIIRSSFKYGNESKDYIIFGLLRSEFEALQKKCNQKLIIIKDNNDRPNSITNIAKDKIPTVFETGYFLDNVQEYENYMH